MSGVCLLGWLAQRYALHVAVPIYIANRKVVALAEAVEETVNAVDFVQGCSMKASDRGKVLEGVNVVPEEIVVKININISIQKTYNQN